MDILSIKRKQPSKKKFHKQEKRRPVGKGAKEDRKAWRAKRFE